MEVTQVEVNICYYPTEWATYGTDGEARYPFYLEGEVPYIVEMEHMDTQALQGLYLMTGVDNYPIYSLAEFQVEDQEELEELFRQHHMPFEFLSGSRRGMCYVKVVIEPAFQFKQYFPHLHFNTTHQSNLSLWSLKQDVFQLKEQEYESAIALKRTKKNRTYMVRPKWMANAPYVTLTKDSTVFWIGHDGAYLTAFSNDQRYATFEKLQQTILKKFELTLGEY